MTSTVATALPTLRIREEIEKVTTVVAVIAQEGVTSMTADSAVIMKKAKVEANETRMPRSLRIHPTRSSNEGAALARKTEMKIKV